MAIRTWDEVETLEELAQEARAQLETINDLEELEKWLMSETITQWLENEVRLVFEAILRVYDKEAK